MNLIHLPELNVYELERNNDNNIQRSVEWQIIAKVCTVAFECLVNSQFFLRLIMNTCYLRPFIVVCFLTLTLPLKVLLISSNAAHRETRT